MAYEHGTCAEYYRQALTASRARAFLMRSAFRAAVLACLWRPLNCNAVDGARLTRRLQQRSAKGRGAPAGRGAAGKGALGRGARGKSVSIGCAAKYRNCWTSGRCCDEGFGCYTKAPGLRFAQCRPNGCVGTCAWECRRVQPPSTNFTQPAEYGAGSQNDSDAVAAMMRPWNPINRSVGRSERLGNLIDSWYFASLPGGAQGAQLSHLVSLTCGIEPSLAKYLGTQLYRVSASAEQAAAARLEASRHDSWGLYSYPTIKILMPHLRQDLRRVLHSYAATYDPSLSQQTYEGGKRHLVIHYRLGDFTTNGWCIPVRAIVATAAALDPRIVEIMDGGQKHLDQVDGWSATAHRANRSRVSLAISTSSILQQELESSLRAELPAARIVRQASARHQSDLRLVLTRSFQSRPGMAGAQ